MALVTSQARVNDALLQVVAAEVLQSPILNVLKIKSMCFASMESKRTIKMKLELPASPVWEARKINK